MSLSILTSKDSNPNLSSVLDFKDPNPTPSLLSYIFVYILTIQGSYIHPCLIYILVYILTIVNRSCFQSLLPLGQEPLVGSLTVSICGGVCLCL